MLFYIYFNLILMLLVILSEIFDKDYGPEIIIMMIIMNIYSLAFYLALTL